MTLDDYAALPWTVHGRAMRDRSDDEPYYLITIAELPYFSMVCDTRAEAEADFPLVLREYIEAMLASGATPPVPAA